ncbi:carbohydrate kinase family protein [Methanocella paludicola]|uniref:carbohydrate kinase family protein n=1 Tax=Methanocella paludicola TaxID=570267 RepID=UPI001E319C19|nr:carbohydrate kinase family protein [Methanocella paludicola]
MAYNVIVYDVFCYGAISLDISGRLERQQYEHEQATAIDYRMSVGGDAALAALTLSSLGMRVGLAGSPIGDDPMGDYVLWSLEKEGVKALVQKVGKTALTAIVLDRLKRSTITFHDNTPEDEIPIPDDFKSSKYVYVDGCFGRNGAIIAKAARAAGIPAQLNLDVPSIRNIGLFDVVIAGEEISKLISDDPVEAARKIYEANNGLAIVTLGEMGCICCDGAIVSVPAFDTEAVDTTGAGAAFAAGFMYARLRGMSLEECLEFASAAGALKVTARGSYRKTSAAEVFDLISAHKNRL